ncbi:MAG: 8-amino-7-oxononanoate synthase [Gammaproteobacteria bacterium]|jgi:8-amino-7-oxononanoate synthase|nr:8-amino-7-oxononanoate synthase [Gammaproteobacteria bacterium]
MAATPLDLSLRERLEARRARGLDRTRSLLEGPQVAHPVVDGVRLLSFASNDYLGLAAHPRVVDALRRAAGEFGVGSGASHLLTGHARPHRALEEALATFTGRPRALLFSTGYMANLAVATALLDRHDGVFEDRYNHASLVDAGLLSRARLHRYPHADAQALGRQLAASPVRHRLILTDGVFSMDGDLAPLTDLRSTAQAAGGAWLCVDDAHGLGVVGPSGRGTLEQAGVGQEDVPILVGTLGKAFGTFGAFVAGSEALIEALVQFARSYVYTTALPPAVAAATLASLDLASQGEARERLHARIRRFHAGAAQLGLPLRPTPSAIQPVPLGDAARALEVSSALRRRGILVPGIRPPTVPAGSARLRISFSAAHSPDDVDRLLDALSAVLR